MTSHIIQVGDAVLADTKGLYGRLIQFGQKLRWQGHSQWHHGAIVVEIDKQGVIWCVQMARRGERVRIQDIAPGRPLKIIPAPEGIDIDRAISYANTLVGVKYGIATIISIAFNILTPAMFYIDFRRDGTLICSAAVIRSWEHGGLNYHADPFQVSPAQIDMLYGQDGWVVNWLAA